MNPSKPVIPVLHNMARSGGTLISKCIGCMDDIALLSEVHPFVGSSQFNPMLQAQNWFGIDVAAKLQALELKKGLNWLEGIELIYGWVAEQGKILVVRDWSHLDYTGVPWVQPTYKLSTADVLGRSFDVRQAVTVRHPVDQWNSLSRLGVIAGKLQISDFLKGYRAFAEQAVDIGFVRYEDFTAAPAQRLKQLCDMLFIPYDGAFVDKWSSYTNITGDVSSNSPGRGNALQEIKPLERKTTDERTLEAFRASPDFGVSLELLGYVE